MTADDKDPYRLLRKNSVNRIDQEDVRPQSEHSLGGIGWFAVIAGILNFLACPLIRGSESNEGGWVLISGIVGFVAAEVSLAALWLVWGPGSFWRRLLVHWGVVLALFGCWAFGLALAMNRDVPAGEIPAIWGAMICSLPIVTLAVQLPMWPLRAYSWWRIDLPRDAVTSERQSSLSIGDLILGTAVTAVSLGALRFMPRSRGPIDIAFWATWGITMLSIAGASAVVLVPAILMVFRPQEPVVGGILLAGYGLVAWI